MNTKRWLSLYWTYTQVGFPPQEAGLHATRDEARARSRDNRLARIARRKETDRRRQEVARRLSESDSGMETFARLGQSSGTVPDRPTGW